MQNIDSDLIRGNIDTIILKTMLDGDMYGLDIIREVENRSNGTYELKQPTLYSCLKRLENQELISSYWLDSNIGGKRHYYKLTEKGLEKIKSKQEEWSKSKFIIDNLLGDFDSDEYRLVKKDDYEKIIEGKPIIQYITVPTEETTNNQSSATQNQLSAQENQNTSFESPFDINDLLQESDDFDNNFSDFIPNNEPEEVPKIQTLSEYQSAIEDVMNSKTTFIEEDNDLICFNENSNSSKNENFDNKITENLVQSNFDSNQETNNILSNNQIQSESVKSDFVQQNIFDNLVYPYQNEVDKSILEFTKNISRLNDFDYSDETKRQEELEKQRLLEEENQRRIESEKLAELNKDEQKTDNTISTNVDSSQYHIESIDKDFLSELDSLNQKNDAVFDDIEYSSKIEENSQIEEDSNNQKNANFTDNNDNFVKNIALSEKNAFIDYRIEPNENSETQYKKEEITTNFLFENKPSVQSNFSFQDDEPEAFFELNYTTNFTPTKENEEYKKKLQNLTEYSKINANVTQPVQQNIDSKDITVLKQEFAKEGIKLRQYSKANERESEKNHILINKLNLIKSLILLFSYTFILSASYIIMKNTALKDILNFSVYPFVYAIIPFAVYCLYYLILFIINPQKKTPAKYSPRIMMFFSIIITIQLLLIIYCSNLQFGFYSFRQVGYNHLLWIIPSIMSITPIIITTIHICLYNSKNFNV